MTMRRIPLFFLFLITLTFGCTMTFDDSWLGDDDSACDDDDAVADDDVADDDDVTPLPDADADGDPDVTDCDDTDAAIYSGAPELCDEVDSDCDLSLVDEFGDMDGDGEPDCVDNDVDGDGYTEQPDCDDGDPAISPDAPELCDDGMDNDCDGDVDGEDEECVDEDDEHEVTIVVTYGYATPAVDFSYGYCSNLQEPEDCNDWNQSVVTATPNASQVSFTIQGVTGGVIRANSSRFYQQSDYNSSTGTWSNADSWLCQLGPSGPELTGAVYIYVDGVGLGHFGYCIPFGNGSSLGLEIGAIIGSAIEN